jgi:hypothetical protein
MIPLLNRGGMMKGFVQGADRQQTTLLPEDRSRVLGRVWAFQAMLGFALTNKFLRLFD